MSFSGLAWQATVRQGWVRRAEAGLGPARNGPAGSGWAVLGSACCGMAGHGMGSTKNFGFGSASYGRASRGMARRGEGLTKDLHGGLGLGVPWSGPVRLGKAWVQPGLPARSGAVRRAQVRPGVAGFVASPIRPGKAGYGEPRWAQSRSGEDWLGKARDTHEPLRVGRRGSSIIKVAHA